MTLRNRVRAIERRTAAAERRGDTAVRMWANLDRERAEFLTHIPEGYRPAVAAALDDPDPVRSEQFASWQLWPFARWAGPIPAGFVFPPAFVAWLLEPPRDYWFGSHCGRCGMAVPLFFTRSNDTDPPPTIIAFPACPACGGRTSHAAHYQPDPPTTEGGKPCG